MSSTVIEILSAEHWNDDIEISVRGSLRSLKRRRSIDHWSPVVGRNYSLYHLATFSSYLTHALDSSHLEAFFETKRAISENSNFSYPLVFHLHDRPRNPNFCPKF